MPSQLSTFENKLKEAEFKLSRTANRDQPIYDKVEGWVIEYPEFEKLVDEQGHSFWMWDEHPVTNDIDDLRVNATPAEQAAISYCLQLFTHYELRVGDDYWMNRIGRRFKRPEFQRMATMFAAVELNSHAPFYSQANEVLNLNTPEFYSQWKIDADLVARMDFVEKLASSKDDLLSIAGFSFIEGSVLYSSFAFFKHFQSQECGKDLIKNFCRGINLSVADENTHAIGGALLFAKLLKERNLTEDEKEALAEMIYFAAHMAYEHECKIIDKIFSFGEIKGITAESLKDFVKHRIDLCLNNLRLKGIFTETPNDRFIESWFYNNINSLQFHDFFTGGGSEYDSTWNKDAFAEVFLVEEEITPYNLNSVFKLSHDILPTFPLADSYIIFTRENCRFCIEAKEIALENDVQFCTMQIGKNLDTDSYRNEILINGAKFTEENRPTTLPQIFRKVSDIEYMYIGGGEAFINELFSAELITL